MAQPTHAGNYLGKAGQLAAMSEFLLRGYNVAMPEVDMGDDIFVVHDPDGELWRIQVKTALGVPRANGFSARFIVPMHQLTSMRVPDTYFVLAARSPANGWEYVTMPRMTLERFVEVRFRSSRGVAQVSLYLSFREREVICANADWQCYRNQWQPWGVTA